MNAKDKDKAVVEETPTPGAETPVVQETGGVPATINFEEDSGAGFEEAGAKAYAIPFIRILQANSPQCKRSDGKYIPGAQEGMFFNTVTEELFETLTVVPCHFTQTFIEWEDRNAGGAGIVQQFNVADGERRLTLCTRNDKNKDVTPDGNILVDTRNHFLVHIGADGSTCPVLLTCSSTETKKSKKWMTLMQNQKLGNGAVAPMFSRMYKLTTVPETKDEYSWMGLKIDLIGPVTDARVYNDAKTFREMVRSGAAVASTPDADEPVPF